MLCFVIIVTDTPIFFNGFIFRNSGKLALLK